MAAEPLSFQQAKEPSAHQQSYWHARWVKTWNDRNRWRGYARRLEQRLQANSATRPRPRAAGSSPASSWSTATATWYGPGFYGHSNACGTGTLSESSWWVATVPRQCGRWYTICTSRCVRVQSQDTGGFTAGNFDLTPAVARALGGLHTMTVRYR